MLFSFNADKPEIIILGFPWFLLNEFNNWIMENITDLTMYAMSILTKVETHYEPLTSLKGNSILHTAWALLSYNTVALIIDTLKTNDQNWHRRSRDTAFFILFHLKTSRLFYPQCNLAIEWHNWWQFIRLYAASSGATNLVELTFK